MTQPPEEARERVLASAGASLFRDAADVRLIAGVRARTHRRIDSQDEVGGWPALRSRVAPPTTTATACPTRGNAITA